MLLEGTSLAKKEINHNFDPTENVWHLGLTMSCWNKYKYKYMQWSQVMPLKGPHIA